MSDLTTERRTMDIYEGRLVRSESTSETDQTQNMRPRRAPIERF